MGIKSVEEEKNNPFILNNNVVPVSVIASFNTSGNMLPLYFMVEGIRIKVDRIISCKEGMTWGSQYKVRICFDANQEEVIELLYFSNRNMWVMKKK